MRADRETLPPEKKPKRPVLFDAQRQKCFLEGLSQGLSITSAAARASVSRRVVYQHREADPAFAKAWAEAYEAGTDRLEDAMRAKALQPQGFLANIAMLRARRPEKWGERQQQQQQHQEGVNITINAPDLEQLAKLLGRERLEIGPGSDQGLLPKPEEP